MKNGHVGKSQRLPHESDSNMSGDDAVSMQQVELLEAIASGRASTVKKIIEAGFAVDGEQDFEPVPEADVPLPIVNQEGLCLSPPPDVQFITPLNWAVFNGRFPTAKYLVERGGANVNKQSADGRTALHVACSKGNAEIIQWLCEQEGADVNVGNFAGETPLYHALYSRQASTALYLLEHGADASALTVHGFSVLHMAASRGMSEVLARLLQDGKADSNIRAAQGMTPLHCAAISGRTTAIEVLVQEGKADPSMEDDKGNTPFALAVDQPETGLRLVQLGCLRGSDEGAPALHRACEARGGAAIVEALCVAGVNPNVLHDGQAPLHVAAFNNNVDTCKVLLQQGADPTLHDDDGEDALFYAELADSDELVSLLQSFKRS
eukprot:m.255300 g.255300  ORF g.255300 m.255300 type:complete len:379 (+) comp19159_c0_seq9:78-1214(+)